MKPLSTTALAALFALGLTLLVGGSLSIPYFQHKESQTADEMMVLRYKLESKYAHLRPDPHIVFVAIDDQSLQSLGAWPFTRDVHGQFLQVLAPEKPKTVGWDILFTEAKGEETPAAPPQAPGAAPAPEPASPSPAVPAPPTAPATPTPAPNSSPAAAPPATTAITKPALMVGLDQTTNAPSAPAAVPVMPSAPAPATTAPAAVSPAPPAAVPAPPADNAPPVESGDDQFVDGVALFPNMVMTSALNGGGKAHFLNGQTSDKDPDGLKDEDILPTSPFTHVTGDIRLLSSGNSALIPFPALRKKSYFGFVNQDAEKGGGVRRDIQMVINWDGRVLPSLELQLLMQFWNASPDQVTINLGREIILPRADGTLAHIPINASGYFVVNYRARIEDFQAMSYALMGKGLADKSNNVASPERDHLLPIKDNMVVIGATFIGWDSGPNPLDGVAPLVVTHLNALNNILQQDYLGSVSPWVWMPIYGLFLFVAGNLMLRVGVAPMIPIGLAAVAIVALAGFGVLGFANSLVPVAMPEVGILLLAGIVPTKRFFGEEREKLRMKEVLRANLSEKVMNKMLAHPDNVKLGGTKEIITVMFCDIRGFTAYCDQRDSAEVLAVLNDYMEEMTQVVFKYEGTVDKYIGDCIMAFWNAPDPQPDHAQRAVCCAMEMRYALANFKTKRAGLDTELFECGIGIHTGEALVGMMGSSIKRGYTAMGSTVNLGARLETLTKRLNERILISQEVLDMLQGDFPITDRGEATVPGFAKPVHVYAVGADQDISSALSVGRTLASQQEYTAEEVQQPMWEPAPLPEDADPNP